jgi:DNA repair/transcription protein MET18/MMS19
MNEFQTVVNQFCSVDSDDGAQRSAQARMEQSVVSGRVSVVDVVRLLGEPLTSSDDVARARGTELLAACVEACAAQPMPDAHVAVLLQFFVARVDDYNGVEGVLRGLVALWARRSPVTRDGAAACATARALFNNVRVQALPQHVRLDALRLCELLLECGEVRDELGGEFVHGLVQAVDGEKDPRNLLVAFALVARVTQAPVRDWKRYAEDLFEVLACYFPITFRHHADDPAAVTQDQLVVALRRCLTHCSLASFVVPFLLEKLDDAVPGTQRECVVTLVDCLRRAKADGGDASAIAARGEPPATDEAGQVLVEGITEVHAAAIGSAIAAQIVAARDTALVDCCVDSVALACEALTRGAHVDALPQSLLANFLAQIVPAAAAHVERDATLPRLRLDAGRTAAACCRGSEASCAMALKDVLKPLLARVHSAVATVRRADVALAAAMVAAISDRLHSGGGGGGGDDARPHPLLPYRDALIELFRGALLHDPTSAARAAAVAGLGALAAAGCPALLDDSARAASVRIVAEALFDEASAEVRRAALSFLCDALGRGEASVAHAVVLATVLERTVPALLKRVPLMTLESADASAEAPSHRLKASRSLAALAELAQTHERLFEAVVDPLTTLACEQLQRLVGDADGAAPDEQPEAVLLAHIFQCLNVACGRATPRSPAAAHGEAAIVMPLVAALQQRAARTPHRLNVPTMTQLIATVSGRVSVLDVAAQVRVRDAVLASSDVAGVLDGDRGTPAQQQSLQLVCSVVRASVRASGVPRDTKALIDATLSAVRHRACAGDVQLALTCVLAMLINAVDALDAPSELTALAASGNVAAAVALVWALKALMARGGGDAAAKALLVDTVVLKLLCGAEQTPELERMRDVLAAAFGSVLFADGEHVLLHEKRLYKQKYFSIVLPTVLAEYRKRAGESSACGDRLLMALCGALRHMPAPVVALHADTLAPLVGAAVRRSASSGSLAALEAVRALLSTPDSALTRSAADVQSLATALLAIACRTGAPAQQVAALTTLRELSDAVPYRSIFPVKQKAIDSLSAVLNDGKRAVRHEAARTRNHFFTLGGAPAPPPAKHGCG